MTSITKQFNHRSNHDLDPDHIGLDNNIIYKISDQHGLGGCVCVERSAEKLIGLDPIFRSSMKIQISDIESLHPVVVTDSDCDRIFDTELWSNGGHHVLCRVEVMGTVVRVDKRDKRHSYAVDDGTGVMSCVVWQNNYQREVDMSNFTPSRLPQSLYEKFKDLRQFQSSTQEGYDLGDLILVKGKLKEFAGRREIDVLDHRKIENPNVECERWLQLPALYEIYNQHFKVPSTLAKQLLSGAEHNGWTEMALQSAILYHINSPDFSQYIFTERDVEAWPAITNKTVSGVGVKELKPKIRAALSSLETTTGFIYCVRREALGVHAESDMLTYRKVTADSPLAMAVLSVIKQACRSGQNSELGCHRGQVVTQVKRRSEFTNIPDFVLNYTLNLLEESGDLISPVAQRYMPVS